MAPCTFGVCSQDCEVKIHKIKGQTKASSVNSKRNNITSASCSCVEGKVDFHEKKCFLYNCRIDLFVGYALEAKKTCKAKGQNASLILANENVLRTLNPYAYHKMINLEQDQEKFGKSPKINSIDVFYMDGMPILVVGVKEDRMIYYQKMSNGRSTVVSQNIEVEFIYFTSFLSTVYTEKKLVKLKNLVAETKKSS